MTAPMVERVAQAAEAYAATLPPGSKDAPFIYSHRHGLAKAMIAAMRVPTDKMVAAAFDDNAHGIWIDMIDAALIESGND